MRSEISEIKGENEAIKSAIEAIKGDNEAIKSAVEAIKRENEARKGENEALSADNTKLRELLDGHNKRLVILEGDLAASDKSNKHTQIHTGDSQIFTNISRFNQGEANINLILDVLE